MSGENLVFHVGKTGGYETLFKRLRDTFAHGHYGAAHKHGWIELHHRYKGPKDSSEATRLYGRLRKSSLEVLLNFVGPSKKAAP